MSTRTHSIKLRVHLVNAVRMSYPDDSKIPCVFTDTSEAYWSGVVTQVEPDELMKNNECSET